MFACLSISKLTFNSHDQRKIAGYLNISMDTHLGMVRIVTEKLGPDLLTSAKYNKSLKSDKG